MTTEAAALPVGTPIRVKDGPLEGAIGTVVDPDGGLPECPHLIRVALPGTIPPAWWIDPSNLEPQR